MIIILLYSNGKLAYSHLQYTTSKLFKHDHEQ